METNGEDAGEKPNRTDTYEIIFYLKLNKNGSPMSCVGGAAKLDY